MNRRDRRGPPSPVTVANEQVSILAACQLIGMDLPDHLAYGRNPKIYCPFGELYHVDSGAEAAMRIYVESNHLWCFAGCGYFSPVSLVARAFDLPHRVAADELLERAGIRPPTPDEVWRSAVGHHEPPDRDLLAEALKTFCRRQDPGWDDTQFHPGVAPVLSRCLALLDHVDSDEAAAQWLSGCKEAMSRTLAVRRTMDTPS